MPRSIIIWVWNMISFITEWCNIFERQEIKTIMWHAPITISLKICLRPTSHIPIQWEYSNEIEKIGIFKPQISEGTSKEILKPLSWWVRFFGSSLGVQNTLKWVCGNDGYLNGAWSPLIHWFWVILSLAVLWHTHKNLKRG